MADIVFSNVRVIDGSNAPAFAGEVRVHGNRIREIARDGAKVSRDGAEVVDGGGQTLMPGLIEAHGHLSFGDGPNLECLGVIPPEEHLLLTLKNARKMLDAGFTSVCSAASAKARLDVVVKRAIDAGDFPGPRTLAASPELTVTGGLGDVRLSHVHRDSFGIICDGADEFRRVAREMVREGVDTLKINPSGDEFVPHARANMTVMTEAEVAAVCDVAHALGKRVAAHARSAGAVKLCVKHGVQIVYHATLCDDEALAALESARDWVFVAPTLGITHATLYDATPWGITTEVATNLGMKRELDIAVANMKELKKRGVRVLPGGDYGFAWNPIGADARDLEHFVNYLGFTPMEAIVSATKLGAEIMMQGAELGQVREGFLADVILVDGDPLADIRVLQDGGRITGVMKDGEFHKRPGARKAAAVAAE
jgi:imidazolonepropionase-like amidohydrolase